MTSAASTARSSSDADAVAEVESGLTDASSETIVVSVRGAHHGGNVLAVDGLSGGGLSGLSGLRLSLALSLACLSLGALIAVSHRSLVA